MYTIEVNVCKEMCIIIILILKKIINKGIRKIILIESYKVRIILFFNF